MSLKMMKRIVIAIMLLSLVSILGCEEISRLTQGGTQTSSPPSLKILKAVELGSEWNMKQILFEVGAEDEVLILLKLSEEDKVDGYFYLEKGDDIGFQITGKTLLYKSAIRDGVSSDRFSLVATQAEGDTYTLAFRNTADDDGRQTTVTVFLEVIYPVSGSIYVPVESK